MRWNVMEFLTPLWVDVDRGYGEVQPILSVESKVSAELVT